MDMWISSTTCDICGKEATEQGEFFFDAKLNWCNAWALICEQCVIGNVYGLGEGQGQQYISNTREKVDPPTFNVKSYKLNPIDALL